MRSLRSGPETCRINCVLLFSTVFNVWHAISIESSSIWGSGRERFLECTQFPLICQAVGSQDMRIPLSFQHICSQGIGFPSSFQAFGSQGLHIPLSFQTFGNCGMQFQLSFQAFGSQGMQIPLRFQTVGNRGMSIQLSFQAFGAQYMQF